MFFKLFVRIGFLGLVAAQASAGHANDYLRYSNGQEVLRKTVEAYGGQERLQSLNSISFETDSTYFAFHQSFGVGEDWDPQPQRRHYAIDFKNNEAAFGRDMAEWSFHDKYAEGFHFRYDQRRRTYTKNAHAKVESLAHIILMNPAVIVKKMLQAPRNVRLTNPDPAKAPDEYRLAFADPVGRFFAIVVDPETWLLKAVELVTLTEPFGDVARSFKYHEHQNIDGIAIPTMIHAVVLDNVEFSHRIKNVQINHSIAQHIRRPDGFSLVSSPTPADWKIMPVRGKIHTATNGVYNIPLVEFDDHILAYNASRNPADVAGALKAIGDAFPDKPLRQVILSHHHFDRAGAVGAYSETGAHLLAAARYRKRIEAFYLRREIKAANATASVKSQPVFVPISDETRLGDEADPVVVLNVPGNTEAEILFVLYSPKAKTLIHDGDLFRKYADGPLRNRRADSVALERLINSKGLDVEILIGNRGVTATFQDLQLTNAEPQTN